MLFKSRGYAQGKYNPGGSRKKKGIQYGVRSTKLSKKKGKTSTRSKKVGKSKVKSSGSKINYSSVISNLADNQLSVYKYPFSTATKYPKIPDGKVDLSIGLPFNYSRQIRFPREGKAIFWLFPGITDCVSVFHVNGGTTTHISNGHFIQHCLPFKEPQADIDSARKLDYSLTGYGKYRYVSCGLRVGSDCDWLENSSTWRAVRFPFGRVQDWFRLNNQHESSLFHFIFPKTPLLPADKLALNPTFQTGSVKELGQYEFRLKDSCIEHDFVEIPMYVEFDKDEIDEEGNDVAGDGLDRKDVFAYIGDKQFDCVYLEIDLPPAGAAKDVMISYHCSANVEMIPNQHGNYWHFASSGVTSSKFKKVQADVEKYHRLPGVLNAKNFAKKSTKVV